MSMCDISINIKNILIKQEENVEIKTEKDQYDDKPLMYLMRWTTGLENYEERAVYKKGSVLIEILQQELNIQDANNLHELEIDIYSQVLQQYLTDWPKWDELEAIVADKKHHDLEELKKILDREYESLKQYLQVVIDTTKPLAEEAVKTVETEKQKQTKNDEIDDVVMEVQCTQNQLAQLICRAPDPKRLDMIFNIKPTQPSVTPLNIFTLDSILSWYQVSMQIDLTNFLFKSSNLFKLDHTLLNKALKHNCKRPPIPLDETLLIKPKKKYENIHEKDQCSETQMVDIVNDCSNYLKRQFPMHEQYITSIFEFVLWCVSLMHEKIIFPANYRVYLNNYAYIRYLYNDEIPENVEGDDVKYDLQLEQKLSPLQDIYIGKVTNKSIDFVDLGRWLIIECLFCAVKFKGLEELDGLINHFIEYHQYEKDWQCSHCKAVFTMSTLAANRWQHLC